MIAEAAAENKYTFVVFFKQNDSATSAMSASLQKTLANDADRCVITFVKVDEPSERALVAKYDVSRAPMPMALAIAPNGAITGMLNGKFATEHVRNSFVTPTMMSVMKSLQEGKLVLVTVRGSVPGAPPAAVRDLQNDPHFGTRLIDVSVNAADPEEALFMNQMKIDPQTAATHLTLLAPPGIVVGKFASNATKSEIAFALAEKGKCCDDPNCKHNQSPGRAATAPQGTRK